MADKVVRFWETKTLTQMSEVEWELVCDGCGLCCLQKLEDDEDSGVFYTRIACKLLDLNTCRCCHYAQRKQFVPDCITLTPEDVVDFNWLPPTCGYRRLANAEALPDWHPLLSGDSKTVHRSGISMRGKMISEEDVTEGQWEDYLIFRVD